MKDWNIVFQKNQNCRTDDERFWCSFALSRLQKTSEALNVLMEGTTPFRMSTRCQILMVDIEVAQNDISSAHQRLIKIAPQCKSQPYFFSQWSRLFQKTQQILGVIKAKTPTTQAKLEYQPRSEEDWQRLLSLHGQRPELQIEHLQWIFFHHPNPQKIFEKILQILNECDLKFYHIHIIFKMIHSSLDEAWPFLIDNVFPFAHQINPDPLQMWIIWWKQCPITHQVDLLNAMQREVEVKPNFKLENWISHQRNPS